MKKYLWLLLVLLALPAAQAESRHTVSVTVFTKVFEDGQRAVAAAIEYDAVIARQTVSAEDYTVDGYTVTQAYTSDAGQTGDNKKSGCYVILELSGGDKDESAYSNRIALSVTQTGDIATTLGSVYAPDTQAYVTEYQYNSNEGVDDFGRLAYTDINGDAFLYNVYVPQDFDETKSYPIILYWADAAADSVTDPVRALTYCNDAEVLAGGSLIVVVPQFTGAGAQEAENAAAVLDEVAKEYHAGTRYLAARGTGCTAASQLLAENNAAFAASLFIKNPAGNDLSALLSENRIMVLDTLDSSDCEWLVSQGGH